jgi:hypothetical protein
MAYGTVKVDNITFTDNGVDRTITVSGIFKSISGDITVTGRVQAETIVGTTSVSGATVTGNVGQFTNLVGVSGQFTSVTGASAGFTTVTGTTVTGTNANFVTVSGTTVTGLNANFVSGVFTSTLSGATANLRTANITSGVFALGSVSAPSISFSGDPDTGIYSSSGNRIAFATSGMTALFIDEIQRVVNGHNTSIQSTNAAGVATGPQYQQHGTNQSQASVSTAIWVNSASYPSVVLNKSRGAGIGTHSAVPNNDPLGYFIFTGSDGTSFQPAAWIGAIAEGAATSGSVPSRIIFGTTVSGGGSPTERLRITSSGVLQIADSGNISVGTTNGTKIGTATTQKIGFYNATPIVQPTAVADATDAATVITQLNALLSRMRSLGLIAT